MISPKRPRYLSGRVLAVLITIAALVLGFGAWFLVGGDDDDASALTVVPLVPAAEQIPDCSRVAPVDGTYVSVQSTIVQASRINDGSPYGAVDVTVDICSRSGEALTGLDPRVEVVDRSSDSQPPFATALAKSVTVPAKGGRLVARIPLSEAARDVPLRLRFGVYIPNGPGGSPNLVSFPDLMDF